MSLFLRAATVTTLLGTGLLAQSPAPTAVLNPASNIPASLPNGGIAEGSIFVVYGKNLGPANIVQASAVPLPTSGLSGTSVTVTVNGTTVTAPMLYTLATQVAGVLPSSTPVGTGTLTVIYNGASGTVPITVVKSNFGTSTVNLSGGGPAVVTFPNYSLISVTNSAKPGDVVVLWGTGLGPIPGNDAAVPVPTDLGTPIQVYVGGQQATVTYRGRSAAPGLDQINFQVPAGLSGCYIPIAVQNGSTVSNFTTMAVAAGGGACSDATGLPISNLGSSGTATIGEIALVQISSTTPAIGLVPASTTTSAGASAIFEKFTTQQLTSSGSFSGQPSLGGCLVSSYVSSTSTAAPAPVTAIGLNAGPSISIAGPLNLTLNTAAQSTGIYTAFSLQGLPAGAYTASNGAGGPDVGGFTTTLNLAQPLVWTNQASTLNVNRTQALSITWTGGDPKSYVVISGSSSTGTLPISIASFTCTAPTSAGQFTVPGAVLLSLPASSSSFGIPTGSLEVGSYTSAQTFTARGIDYGFVLSASINAALMNYQ